MKELLENVMSMFNHKSKQTKPSSKQKHRIPNVKDIYFNCDLQVHNDKNIPHHTYPEEKK